MLYNNIIETIGNTPIIKLNNITENDMADVYVKLEYFNPGGSAKDRAALYMIQDMEKEGLIKKGDTIVEATSGNTGIGLAMVATALGYKSLFTMPESMSIERRKILKSFGASLELTPASQGMKGAIQKAEEIAKQPGFIMARQFDNKSNPKAHYYTTAKEIMDDFETLDAFVASVGTGGTLTGVAKALKDNGYKTQIVAVEPKNSPVLSGGKPSPHKIQGIGAGFIPSILDTDLIDEIIQITDDEAYEFARDASTKEALPVGISSGATLCAAIKKAKQLGKGKKVLFIATDNNQRYLSTDLF